MSSFSWEPLSRVSHGSVIRLSPLGSTSKPPFELRNHVRRTNNITVTVQVSQFNCYWKLIEIRLSIQKILTCFMVRSVINNESPCSQRASHGCSDRASAALGAALRTTLQIDLILTVSARSFELMQRRAFTENWALTKFTGRQSVFNLTWARPVSRNERRIGAVDGEESTAERWCHDGQQTGRTDRKGNIPFDILLYKVPTSLSTTSSLSLRLFATPLSRTAALPTSLKLTVQVLDCNSSQPSSDFVRNS